MCLKRFTRCMLLVGDLESSKYEEEGTLPFFLLNIVDLSLFKNPSLFNVNSVVYVGLANNHVGLF